MIEFNRCGPGCCCCPSGLADEYNINPLPKDPTTSPPTTFSATVARTGKCTWEARTPEDCLVLLAKKRNKETGKCEWIISQYYRDGSVEGYYYYPSPGECSGKREWHQSEPNGLPTGIYIGDGPDDITVM